MFFQWKLTFWIQYLLSQCTDWRTGMNLNLTLHTSSMNFINYSFNLKSLPFINVEWHFTLTTLIFYPNVALNSSLYILWTTWWPGMILYCICIVLWHKPHSLETASAHTGTDHISSQLLFSYVYMLRLNPFQTKYTNI